MNTGKTLFAQLMDFLPWTTFTRIVDRYGGDHRVRTLSCAEQYAPAFPVHRYRSVLPPGYSSHAEYKLRCLFPNMHTCIIYITTFIQAGAIYVVDRGYADFARLYVLHQAGAFFVTRVKWSIGGVFDSGFVLAWATCGPIGALILFPFRKSVIWFLLYLVNVVITVVFDDFFASHGQVVEEGISPTDDISASGSVGRPGHCLAREFLPSWRLSACVRPVIPRATPHRPLTPNCGPQRPI